MPVPPQPTWDAASVASSSSGYPLPGSTTFRPPVKRSSQPLPPTASLLTHAKDGKVVPRNSEDSRVSSEVDVREIAALDGQPAWFTGDTDGLSPPPDRYKLVYLIFLALGLATLLPWNVYINAAEFFRTKFENSPFKDTFQNWFSTCYTTTNLLTLAMCIMLQHRFRPRPVIIASLLGSSLMFLLMAILARVSDLRGTPFFGITLIVFTLSAAVTSLSQCAAFALVAYFPPLYIQGLLSGQAVAGVIASLVQLITAVSSMNTEPAAPSALPRTYGYDPYGNPNYPFNYGIPMEPVPVSVPISRTMVDTQAVEMRAFVYFLIAAIVCALVLGLFILLHRLPFFRHFSPAIAMSTDQKPFTDNLALVLKTARSIWLLIVTVTVIFCGTISVFPSLTIAVKPVNFLHIPFVEIHFLLFNLGDWTGRWLSMVPLLRFLRERIVFCGALCHLIFIPLLLLCNTSFDATVHRLIPAVIQSDVAFFLIILVFGISTGYWGSLTMMTGPQQAVDKGRASTVLTFFLIFGMALGSVVGFAITALSCNCNPFALKP
ncbi:hypothetical protein H4R34_003209 [Dimargaris verticillata]|uniref:Nucleoside transporter-domain-containing protein n=1 Tax=Dimargaris verticillata TaxID=2761393 RepID=A0A9W8B6I8_9FUNG|nr:hypothetical protein H4R34_003209 [Dimargaris verticillata]